MTGTTPLDPMTLARTAWDVGNAIDLAGCVYGPAHVEGVGFADTGAGYYALLAGIVRSLGATRVCELGTHYGGATTAMARGLPPSGAGGKIVTVDVTRLDNPALTDPRIERVQGDVLSARVLDDVSARFDDHVDVLFIDIVHGYHQSKRALGLFANRLKPKVIVLDDIHLNGGMDALWAELAVEHACADVTALCERGRAGFGVVVPRYPCAFAEGDAWRVPVWTARRAVAAQLSFRTKTRIAAVLDAVPRPLRKLIDPS